MTAYQLLHKPVASNWTIVRYTKRILCVVVVLIIGYFIISRQSKHVAKLKQIYELQTKLTDILELEMHYMSRQMYTDEDEWIRLNSGPGHIYSAYLDTRPEIILKYSHPRYKVTWGEIFIIALLPTKARSKDLSCVFKYELSDGASQITITPARLKLLEDHWNLEYAAFFVICDLTYPTKYDAREDMYKSKQLPESVGLQWYNDDNNREIEFIDIHYPEDGLSEYDQEPENSMAVCVPVLHHNFDRALELVEFIEYYRMMGIDHFTFYNSSVSPEVDEVLKFYQMRLTATVLNWSLPSVYIYEQTLRQEGLSAALNDCLYRNTRYRKYKYLGTFDVDEFLVPKVHENFHQLLQDLDTSTNTSLSDSAAFIFRNVYFYTMYQDENKAGAEPYLYTREKTRRLRNPNEAHKRSRYFVRGEDTFEIGNYNVWEFRQGSFIHNIKAFSELVVDPEVALLHHYAPCEAEETGCYLKGIQIDGSAQRFSSQLGKRVAKVCSDVFPTWGCPPPVKRIHDN